MNSDTVLLYNSLYQHPEKIFPLKNYSSKDFLRLKHIFKFVYIYHLLNFNIFIHSICIDPIIPYVQVVYIILVMILKLTRGVVFPHYHMD